MFYFGNSASPAGYVFNSHRIRLKTTQKTYRAEKKSLFSNLQHWNIVYWRQHTTWIHKKQFFHVSWGFNLILLPVSTLFYQIQTVYSNIFLCPIHIYLFTFRFLYYLLLLVVVIAAAAMFLLFSCWCFCCCCSSSSMWIYKEFRSYSTQHDRGRFLVLRLVIYLIFCFDFDIRCSYKSRILFVIYHLMCAQAIHTYYIGAIEVKKRIDRMDFFSLLRSSTSISTSFVCLRALARCSIAYKLYSSWRQRL